MVCHFAVPPVGGEAFDPRVAAQAARQPPPVDGVESELTIVGFEAHDVERRRDVTADRACRRLDVPMARPNPHATTMTERMGNAR